MRRTQQELCQQYHRERNNLYHKRSALIKKQQSGKLSSSQQKKYDAQVKKISTRIDKYKSKIFKCGKRYALLKKKHTSIVKKINKLKNQAKKSKSNSEKNRYYSEIGIISRELRDVKKLMGKQIFTEKGKVGFVSDKENNSTFESVQLWLANNIITDLISTNRFDFITVEGEKYSLVENRASALWALEEYIADRHASQALGRTTTPMVGITSDYESGELTID